MRRPECHYSEPAVGSASFFFLPRQSALDAAWMNRNAELFLNRGSQLSYAQRGLFGSGLLHIAEHFGRQLVRSPRPTFFGNQTGQSLSLKIQLGLIVGRARKSKGGSRLTDRLLLDLHAAQHLVLDLDQVVGIEELVLMEQRVLYLLWARVKTSPAA